MRILHLIDPGTPAGASGRGPAEDTLLGCRLALGSGAHEHRVFLICPRGGERVAEEHGVRADSRVELPLGSGRLAGRAVRRMTGDWRPDVIQVWGRRWLGLAAAAEPGHGFVVVEEAADRGGERPAPRFGPLAARCVVVAPVGDAERPAGPDDPARRVFVPPPVRGLGPDLEAREAVRRELGLGSDDCAVLLLGAAPYADAMRFVFLLDLLREAGCMAVGIIPASCAQIPRAARFQRGVRQPRVIVTRRTREGVLPAADLAVWEGGGPGPTCCWDPAPWAAWTPIAAAHAAGVPTVAPRWAMTPELYDPEAAGRCLGSSATLPELARVLLPLVEDRDRRGRAAELVGGHLRSQDLAGGFLEGMERAWAMAAGRACVQGQESPAGALA